MATGVLIMLLTTLGIVLFVCSYLTFKWMRGPTQNIEAAKKLIGSVWRIDDDPFTEFHYEITEVRLSDEGTVWFQYKRPSGKINSMSASRFIGRFE